MNTQNSHTPSPTVSVIIPAYGVAEYIGAALDSVLNQTFTDYEIFVINDGAPDTEELEAVLERYYDRIVYLKHENRGVSEARNTAIRVARGRYLALLDPDDLWEPEYLATQVGILESDPTIDAVYPNAVLFGETPHAGKTYMDICPSEGEVTFESLVTERCQVAIFVTARKEAVIRAGMFDPDIRINGDFDLWLRMVQQGSRIAYTRRILARRRCRPDSLAADQAGLHEDIVRVFDKALKYELMPAERQTLEQERTKHQAMVNLYKGKRAFTAGDFNAAAGYLTRANTFFKSRKIGAVTTALRFTPRLLLRVHNLRNRILSASTKASTQ